MSDLAEFLLARYAEDEAVALDAVSFDYGVTKWCDGGDPDWIHIARWDPARVLADIDAKRRIVQEVSWMSLDQITIGWVLMQLAVPYADHPDYRDDWRPML